MATDWLMLRDEYLRTQVSLKALAQERGVSEAALKRLAAQESWAALRHAQRANDAPDWQRIQEAYLRTAVSLKALAREKGVNLSQLRATAAREGWVALKRAGGLINAADAGVAAVASTPRHNDRDIRNACVTDNPAKINEAAETGETVENGETSKDGETTDAKGRRVPADRGTPDGPEAAANRLARLAAIGDQLTDQLARAAGELDKQVVLRKTRTREMVYEDAEGRGKPVEETVEENVEVTIVDALVNCAGLQKLSATLKNLREATRVDAGDGETVGMVAELMKKLDDEARQENERDLNTPKDEPRPAAPDAEPDQGHALSARASDAACEDKRTGDRRQEKTAAAEETTGD